jgi:hypothetical protein
VVLIAARSLHYLPGAEWGERSCDVRAALLGVAELEQNKNSYYEGMWISIPL